MFKGTVLILLCVSLKYPAQNNRFYNYNVKDGLPGSEIYWIMQDSKGYIWSSGDMGVSRFDGYAFKNFSIENGLPENSTFAITEDYKGRLWFRASTGALSFYQNDTITALKCNDSLSKLLLNVNTTSIYVDSGDTLWIGATSNYIIKILPPWDASKISKMLLPRGKYIYHINNKNFIFGGDHPQDIDISVYHRLKGQLFTHHSVVNNIKSDALRFYAVSLGNNSYAAAVGKEIIWLTDKAILAKRTEASQVIAVCNDNDSSFIVTSYHGVNKYSSSHKFVYSEPVLDKKIVTGVLIDRENQLWYSTEGHGLYCNQFRDFKYYTSENGLSDSKISAILVNDTCIITGHLTGELSVLKKNKILTIAYNEDIVSPISRITSILNVKNRLFVSRIFGGYYLKGIKLEPIPLFSNKPIKKTGIAKDGNLWVMSYNNLKKFETEGRLNVLQTIVTPLKTDDFYEQQGGDVWFGSINGISVFKNNRLLSMTGENKLLKLRSAGIYFGPHNTIWIATKGGGVVLKFGTRYTQITTKEGLAGNMCRSIMGDSNTIWVGTNNGLSKICLLKNGYTIRNYDTKDGLLTNEVNFICKLHGLIYLAHNNGVAIFSPKTINKLGITPLVYIEKVYANDSILLKDKEQVDYWQNNISIIFKGLSFRDKGDLTYRYKLEGLDTSWVFTKYTSIKYQALPPGKYKFIVSVSNHDKLYSESKNFEIIIIPGWWQTVWFKAIVILMFIICMFFILRWYFKKLRGREEEKNKFQHKISEAELKALRAQMNPHFIFNAIASVQYFISGNDPKSSQKYLSKFAKLIRYVVDNSKPETIPLKTEIEALTLYLELESLRFENKFEYEIKLEDHIDLNFTQIPSMLIQPFVENAIWHGLMHKKTKGKIIISFYLKDNLLECTIHDDGVGRKKSKEMKTESALKNHKSIGMALTRERLEILNQIYNITLDYSVQDTINKNNEVTGTIVKIQIPLN